jgi:hypothetical protein
MEMFCTIQAEIKFLRIAIKHSEDGKEDSHSRVGNVALYELWRGTSPKQLYDVSERSFLSCRTTTEWSTYQRLTFSPTYHYEKKWALAGSIQSRKFSISLPLCECNASRYRFLFIFIRIKRVKWSSSCTCFKFRSLQFDFLLYKCTSKVTENV